MAVVLKVLLVMLGLQLLCKVKLRVSSFREVDEKVGRVHQQDHQEEAADAVERRQSQHHLREPASSHRVAHLPSGPNGLVRPHDPSSDRDRPPADSARVRALQVSRCDRAVDGGGVCVV